MVRQVSRKLNATGATVTNGIAEMTHRRATTTGRTEQEDGVREGSYDLVVIGAGTGGLVSSAIAAAIGARVALIEAHRMGGDCLNYGCVPSKALIASARLRASLRRTGEFGLPHVPAPPVDFAAVLESMRSLQARIAVHDSEERFRSLGVDVILGRATFIGPRAVAVGDRVLRFRRAIVATGARPSVPPIEGLKPEMYVTNETVFSMDELPRRFAVLGAGPIGCELAQAFARLGSEVTLIESMHGVLPREERDAAEIVQRALEADGIRVACCGRSLRVSEAPDGYRLQLESHGEQLDFVCDRILIATGRKPNVENMGLEDAGIAYDARKGIVVNDFLQTTNRRVYAVGDVCGSYQFTHAADAMARAAVRNALFYGRARLSRLVIPWCTYTEPELARVGLSRDEAAEKGLEVAEIVQPLSEVDRAVLEREDDGFVRVLLKKGSDRILGATAVGVGAGELISQISFAMTHGIGLSKFSTVVYPYPTRMEVMRKLGDSYMRTRLTPGVKKLLSIYLKVFPI